MSSSDPDRAGRKTRPPVAKPDRDALIAAARAKAEARRRELVGNIRGDIERHGGTFLTRSVIGLAVYRTGAWALTQPKSVRGTALRAYRLLERATRAFTGIHMNCTVLAGDDLHLIHAEGPISIHPDTVLGDRVGIMHNVTIGAAVDAEGAPIIGNDVFIGVGAAIIGPVVVGDGARIAANSLVVSDVPPNSTAIGVPARCYPRMMLTLSKPPAGSASGNGTTGQNGSG